MKDKIKCIPNFLEEQSFKKLQNLIIKSDFAWFKRSNMVGTSNTDMGYFTHSFYNENQINSNYYYEYIKPLLTLLDCKAVIQIRANLFPSSFYGKPGKSAFHVDYEYTSKTAIIYLNTCNGGTEFKINDEVKFIKAEENKVVIFDSDVQHRGTTSTDTDFRYILNFNYF